MAILELVREGLLDLVQTEAYGPLHVRGAGPNRALHLVASNDPVEAEVPLFAPPGAAPEAAAGLDTGTIPPIDGDLDDDPADGLAPLEGVDDVLEPTSGPRPGPAPELERNTAPEPDSSEEP
jgi:hypothetical protein